MSQATSTSVSGDVTFGDPDAQKLSLYTWLIVGAVVVLVVLIFKRK